jgi:hypothetical protein
MLVAGELFGGPFSEPLLIRIAAGFEAATRNRKPPGFRTGGSARPRRVSLG